MVFLYKPFIFFCPDSLTQPFPPPEIFFCPASLTPPPTNLPYTVPHAASHQPPSRSSSLIHAAAAPRSVTLQLLSVTPQILSATLQILSATLQILSATPQISRSSLSHAAALHYNPILGAGRGDAGRSGSGVGRDKLPRPPGRGGVGYW
ncbi:hypothetical protein FCV25MIE_09961 [Fagus crenata]